MEYNFKQDMKAVRKILMMTQAELAEILGVTQITISRNEQGETFPSGDLMEKLYSFAFEQDIRLNRLKEMLWKENIERGHKLLFHGAKSQIEGELSVHRGRSNNDFGQGFYTGENYEQAVSFVSAFERPGVYLLDFNEKGLRGKKWIPPENVIISLHRLRITECFRS